MLSKAEQNARRRFKGFIAKQAANGVTYTEDSDSWNELYVTITRPDERVLVIDGPTDGWITVDLAARAFIENPDCDMFFETDEPTEDNDEDEFFRDGNVGSGTYFLA